MSTSATLPEAPAAGPAPEFVTLSKGTEIDISTFDRQQLRNLQWREERAFATLIREAPKGSRERSDVTAHAYDTICTILRRVYDQEDGHVDMGYNRRYVQLVLDVIARRPRTSQGTPRVFDLGFGSGTLLAALRNAGVDVAGIEVSTAMHKEACRRMPETVHDQLYLGDFLTTELPQASFDVIFWNDVLEHIVQDETHDFLQKIHSLLKPGSALVTITPNWHLRPSDVTRLYQPPRTEAVGFHMQEYTLRDVTAMLRRAGFARVGTPLVVTPGHMYVCGLGLAGLKRLCEPLLERLPLKLTQLLCRGFGLSCTIGWK